MHSAFSALNRICVTTLLMLNKSAICDKIYRNFFGEKVYEFEV